MAKVSGRLIEKRMADGAFAPSAICMSPDGTTRIFITPALGAGYAFLACHRFRKLAATPASPVPSSSMLVGSGTLGAPLRTTIEKFAAASSGFWVDES